MTSLVRLAGAAVLAALLSGCAYKPLKAPCAPDESGTPLAFADPMTRPATPPPFRAFDAAPDHCGPMRPI